MIDPTGTARAPKPDPLATGSRLGTDDAAQHVSRYGTKVPTYEAAPGHGFAAGDSPILGLFLAALTAALLTFALGWVGGHQLRVPLIFSAIIGWGIRRALAAGSGGGTPDRGILVIVGLLAIVAGSFVGSLYIEYRALALREATHFRPIFGEGGYEAAKQTLTELRDRDDDHDDNVRLVEDGTTISLVGEAERLTRAEATGIEADEPYDFYLLAKSGRKGFPGFVSAASQAGLDLRFLPSQPGWPLGGVGTMAWWALEFLTLVVFAFTRVE